MTIKEIGALIRERIQVLGIIQPALSEMAQVSINTFYKIELREANPSVKLPNKLAEALCLEFSLSI
jgi:transcriptional regulator with XRE-family HTH domain